MPLTGKCVALKTGMRSCGELSRHRGASQVEATDHFRIIGAESSCRARSIPLAGLPPYVLKPPARRWRPHLCAIDTIAAAVPFASGQVMNRLCPVASKAPFDQVHSACFISELDGFRMSGLWSGRVLKQGCVSSLVGQSRVGASTARSGQQGPRDGAGRKEPGSARHDARAPSSAA
jgi:hypothetical protein